METTVHSQFDFNESTAESDCPKCDYEQGLL